jgi:hypothetical protein
VTFGIPLNGLVARLQSVDAWILGLSRCRVVNFEMARCQPGGNNINRSSS